MRSWLGSEARRVWFALGASTLVSLVVVLLIFSLVDLPVAQRQWLALLVAWVVFLLAYAVSTWLAFRGLSGPALGRALRSDREERGWVSRLLSRPGMRVLLVGGDTPGFAGQLALMALVGVGGLLVQPGLRSQPVLLGLSAILVTCSWVSMLVLYAVHYARVDHARPSLEFAGDEERGFGDYLYLSAMAQMTFGVTDIAVTRRAMRRVILGHTVLAFTFNTVIVAILVALLLPS